MERREYLATYTPRKVKRLCRGRGARGPGLTSRQRGVSALMGTLLPRLLTPMQGRFNFPPLPCPRRQCRLLQCVPTSLPTPFSLSPPNPMRAALHQWPMALLLDRGMHVIQTKTELLDQWG